MQNHLTTDNPVYSNSQQPLTWSWKTLLVSCWTYLIPQRSTSFLILERKYIHSDSLQINSLLPTNQAFRLKSFPSRIIRIIHLKPRYLFKVTHASTVCEWAMWTIYILLSLPMSPHRGSGYSMLVGLDLILLLHPSCLQGRDSKWNIKIGINSTKWFETIRYRPSSKHLVFEVKSFVFPKSRCGSLIAFL